MTEKKQIEMYFTDTGRDITNIVLSPKTKYFAGNDLDTQLEAGEYAKKLRSYFYQIFNENGKPIGFCVPK